MKPGCESDAAGAGGGAVTQLGDHLGRLLGYTDWPSCLPGKTVQVHVTASEPYEARLVRVRHHGEHPDQPQPKMEIVHEVAAQRAAVGEHPLRLGSYMVVEHCRMDPGEDALAFSAWVYATGRQEHPATVLATGTPSSGLVLSVGADRRLGVGRREETGLLLVGALPVAVRLHQWTFIAVSYDRERRSIRIAQREPLGAALQEVWPVPDGWDAFGLPWVVGARVESGGAILDAFDGKVGDPMIWGCALSGPQCAALASGRSIGVSPLCRWQLGRDPGTDQVVDEAGRAEGRFVNRPVRAVTGPNWTGRHFDWRVAPEEYGAVQFHSDDLGSAGWPAALSVPIPETLPSGVYAVELAGDAGAMDWVPIVVRERVEAEPAEIAVLLPTFTYQAYANEPPFAPHEPRTLGAVDAYAQSHGLLSLYNWHRDGSGVVYADWRRALLNLRPRYRYWLTGRPHGLGPDLELLAFLDHAGLRYAVITDHDLHQEGVDLLVPHRTLVTGSHPEYWTSAGMKAVSDFLEQGGRLAYLGGNGFSGVVGVPDGSPTVIEHRRRSPSPGLWDGAPGEDHLASNGEPSGLWRHRKPRTRDVVGVDITGMGFASGCSYRALPASRGPRARFIFRDVIDEEIGAFGPWAGGAAAYEVDGADWTTGTVAHALVVASATEFDGYSAMDQHGKVRADVVFFETGRGGAVFSVGSIGWCDALPHRGYQNNVAKITANVLERFCDAKPFERPD